VLLVPDAGGVCAVIWVGQCGGSLYDGVRIGNRTLIAAGTEHGVRSEFGAWQTIYDRYNRWRKEGLWEQVAELLRGQR
jgi:hypothetical protein